MDYLEIVSTLFRMFFVSILRLSGDHQYEMMMSLLFAASLVSLYLIANILISGFYALVHYKKGDFWSWLTADF